MAKTKKSDYETRGIGLNAKELLGEKSFVNYMNLLLGFSQRYAVFIAASDGSVGSGFTREHAQLLSRLGLKIDLIGKTFYSYIAAINAGKVKVEMISASEKEPVEHDFSLGHLNCRLKSVCFFVPQANTAIISISGKQYAVGGRGLSIVVFDPVTETLIDSVRFDTCSENFACSRPLEKVNAFIKYKGEHPDVALVCLSLPGFPNESLSDNEKLIRQHTISRGMILQDPNKPISVLSKHFTPQEIVEVLNAPKSYHDVYGVRRFEDTSGRCVNTSAGHRVTIGQPREYERTIYLVGGCRIFGVGSSDKGTIASSLQSLFNDFAPEQRVVVQNYGYYLEEATDSRGNEEIMILNALPVKSGDIVLCEFGLNDKIPHINLSGGAKRPHDHGEIFFDSMAHFTEKGNCLIASLIFEELEQNNFYTGTVGCSALPARRYSGLDRNTLKELDEYKNILVEFYNSTFVPKIGAVVVNCNPFTLGHRYLIEYAAQQVDHLIVFVVQEDKSVFPFEDRLKLVDSGLSDLRNVTVIPSGKFIISSKTFSEYFNKSELQDREIDATLDLTIFCEEIAPCLNISVRFVGEEPYDRVTMQYNDAMRSMLPQYGIEFIEIPRRLSDDVPISASYVRELLNNRDFESIAKIVPPTTLNYLREHF